jgi:hypothetical protein
MIGQAGRLTAKRPAAYNAIRKEASGLRLFIKLLYTLEVRGSNPLPPTVRDLNY